MSRESCQAPYMAAVQRLAAQAQQRRQLAPVCMVGARSQAWPRPRK